MPSAGKAGGRGGVAPNARTVSSGKLRSRAKPALGGCGLGGESLDFQGDARLGARGAVLVDGADACGLIEALAQILVEGLGFLLLPVMDGAQQLLTDGLELAGTRLVAQAADFILAEPLLGAQVMGHSRGPMVQVGDG